MGCDGGTIPKRDEIVKTKQKAEQKNKHSDRVYRWRHCSVSQTPLRAPVVACELGRLYNKEEIITRLLNKTQEASNISHIRGLKDVKELGLHPNPAYDGEVLQNGADTREVERAAWSCPVSGVEMNGKHGFCFPWTCGCVVATRAMNEIKVDVCCRCGAAFSRSNVVNLNPATADQQLDADQRMQERRQKAKDAKKLKSSAKRDAALQNGEDTSPAAGDGPSTSKKCKLAKSVSGAAVASTSRLVTSISGMASSILRDTEFSNVRSKDFSVAKNPNHSEVYKSIFDTHKTANKKLKSNWVTCNPQYY